MANIRRETGRHDWRPQLLKMGNERVRGMMCYNCRAYRYDVNSDLPVTGCLADVKVSNCGTSRLHDYHEQEMARRRAHNEAEYQQDLRDIAMVRQVAESSRIEQHLEKLLREEAG